MFTVAVGSTRTAEKKKAVDIPICFGRFTSGNRTSLLRMLRNRQMLRDSSDRISVRDKRLIDFSKQRISSVGLTKVEKDSKESIKFIDHHCCNKAIPTDPQDFLFKTIFFWDHFF